MESLRRAVLLSGGVDSLCLTYNLRPDIAYTINYGQIPAQREIYVSAFICEKLGIEHRILNVDCSEIGSGNLVNKESTKNSPSEEWWPYRNQLLITLALMDAIKKDVSELHIASVKSDSFHRDGTSKFYKLMNDLSEYQEAGIKIICKTTEFYSHELVQQFNVPSEYILMAHSCHVSNIACGRCSGCLKQIRVRQEVDLE